MPDLNAQRRALREAISRMSALHPADLSCVAPCAKKEPLTDDDLAYANLLANGQVRFPPLDKVIRTGRRDIDWSGGHLVHQEWPTQLGRFFMLRPLVLAFENTKEGKFAEAARDYIEDWLNRFDLEDITLRGNTCMDIGIRLGTHGRGGWAPALAVFMDAPSWDNAFVERMFASMERQAHILWRRGIPSRPWGNHRIFGLDGLLHICLRLPFMTEAGTMLKSAREGLRQALRSQFLDDGAHIEETLGYHQHMAETFIYLQRLGKIFPEADLGMPLDRMLPAIDYLVHTLPGGINDTAAESTDRDHAATWELARQWRQQLTGRAEPSWRPVRDAVFPFAGQVFARSSWEVGADFLAFDAARYAGSHAHLARMGIVFRSGGRLWLADPGTFDYEMSNPYAIYGRSTAAHCTLNLNGLNQGLGDARLLRSVLNDRIVFLHGLYQGGYWRGSYSWGFQHGVGAGVHGQHERMVLWIRGEYLLIFDAMGCDPGNTVESVWQMAPVKGWEQDAEQLCWTTRGESPGFLLQMVLPPEGVKMSVAEGQTNPLRGWFCDGHIGGNKPAPQIVFRYPSSQNGFYTVLAMPLAGGTAAPTIRREAAGAGRYLELAWPDGRRDCIGLSSCLAVPLDADSPFQTDSPLVWLRLAADGTPERHFMLDGATLAYRDRTIVRSQQKIKGKD